MLKTNRPVFHISQTVTFSESDGIVFSGVSNDFARLVKFVSGKSQEIVTRQGNNPVAEGMKIEQWNPDYPEITKSCEALTKVLK